MNPQQFSSLSLSAELLANLESLAYHQMTPIQAAALPAILEGHDVIGQATTGSGKTAAFALGLLSQIDVQARHELQALVLCPTRELADQVCKEIRRLARFTANIKVVSLCGGVPMSGQTASLAAGAHIAVGTPGRIEDHLSRRNLRLGRLKVLVLDEADRMLDMGFAPSLNYIISRAPAQRQTLLFSATYPAAIQEMSTTIQNEPLFVKVADQESTSKIHEEFYAVEDKDKTLVQLLGQHENATALVFCNTKIACQEVADYLRQHHYKALALHGDLEQRERDETLVLFSNRSHNILVATDVAARGLDIKDLGLVINYDLPRQGEVYVHRIGRTGRAGQQGLAVSLVSGPEQRRVASLGDYLGRKLSYSALAARKDSKPSLGEAAQPAMVTLKIAAGRKNKLRKADILGALTGETGQLEAADVGKIDIFDFHTWVAVDARVAHKTLARLEAGTIKGRQFKVRLA